MSKEKEEINVEIKTKSKKIGLSPIGKKKYFVIFLRSEYDNLVKLKRVRIKPTTKTIRYDKDNAHILNMSKPLYSEGLKSYYFIDIDKGQISIKEGDANYDPSLIDKIMNQSIIAQLTASFGTRIKMGLMNIILYLGFGVAIGFIVRGFFGG